MVEPDSKSQEKNKTNFTTEGISGERREKKPSKESKETAEVEPSVETKEEPEIKKKKKRKQEEGLKKQKKKVQKKEVESTKRAEELTEEIEGILEEGLQDSFERLNPTQQQEFKLKGEETAKKIKELIQTGGAKIKKIFDLIFNWLKELPGVNKFFLEQEAKIKADKIMDIQKRKEEKEGVNIKEE